MSRDICVFTRLLGGAIDADARVETLDSKVGVQLWSEHQKVVEHTSAGRRHTSQCQQPAAIWPLISA
jgi:hypothetical protein